MPFMPLQPTRLADWGLPLAACLAAAQCCGRRSRRSRSRKSAQLCSMRKYAMAGGVERLKGRCAAETLPPVIPCNLKPSLLLPLTTRVLVPADAHYGAPVQSKISCNASLWPSLSEFLAHHLGEGIADLVSGALLWNPVVSSPFRHPLASVCLRSGFHWIATEKHQFLESFLSRTALAIK